MINDSGTPDGVEMCNVEIDSTEVEGTKKLANIS